MKVLLTGGSGQLGFEIKCLLPLGFTLMAPTSTELDIRSATQVANTLCQLQPQFIINAAAFTAVDNAEQNQAQAFAVNEAGVKYLAQYGVPIIHLSTDYVFDGALQRPYQEDDAAAPLNIYGQSKLAGEQALQTVNPRHLILRTGWLFGVHGTNFVKAIINKAQRGERLAVVSDQFGTPTAASALAAAIWQLVERYREQNPLPWGIYHFAGQSPLSWYEFAQVIIQQAVILGLLKQAPDIVPIKSTDYRSAARRPLYSVLDSRRLQQHLSIKPPDWQQGLRQILLELSADCRVR